jgi:hypothetical protein
VRADGALTRAGGELRYDSDSQDAENLVISRQTAAFECSPTSDPAAAPCLQFANGRQNIRDQAAGCVQVIATVVTCSPATDLTSIFLKLDDGDDFVRVLNSVPATTMDGSFGNDNLDSRNGADTARGGPGDDWHQVEMQALGGDGITVFIPPDANKRQGTRPGWNGGLQAFMRRVLAMPAGAALYRRRQGMIEPVFADTKFNRRIDRFLRRGRAACRSEWRLITATHNLRKLHQHQLATAA